jgi:polyketide cyclase/dehydrase/lipid transport protein
MLNRRTPVAALLAAAFGLGLPVAGCLELEDPAMDLSVAEQPLGLPGLAEEPRQPGTCSKLYREETVIDADLSTVWALIADFPGYERWNPFVVHADAEADAGATVPIGVALGNHVLEMSYFIQVVEPEQRLCTRDVAWFSLFVYGQRCRMVELLPDGRVHFWQELLVDGPFTGLADLTFAGLMRQGMVAETAALKQQAEAL